MKVISFLIIFVMVISMGIGYIHPIINHNNKVDNNEFKYIYTFYLKYYIIDNLDNKVNLKIELRPNGNNGIFKIQNLRIRFDNTEKDMVRANIFEETINGDIITQLYDEQFYGIDMSYQYIDIMPYMYTINNMSHLSIIYGRISNSDCGISMSGSLFTNSMFDINFVVYGRYNNSYIVYKINYQNLGLID